VTIHTALSSSTANELPLGSPVSNERICPVARFSVPTTPSVDANQTSPFQSGSAEMILSPIGTALVRSKSRSWTKPDSAARTTYRWRVVVGMIARSSWSR
jgi:hypothetical protein